VIAPNKMDEKEQLKDIKERKAKYLAYYRKLPIQKLAAAHVSRDEDTIIRWRKQDSDFADQVEIAKSDWAMEKVSSVRSKEWLLERIMKDHFAERKEQTGANGAPLTVGVVSYADTKPKT